VRALRPLEGARPGGHLRAVLLLGAAGAAWVGYETSLDPLAAPGGLAVALRVAIILTLILSGAYARRFANHREIGGLLIVAGLFSIVWLMNGSPREPQYLVGVTAAGLAPGLFGYLMLAFPSGRISSLAERRFILASTALLGSAWLVGVLSGPRTPICTPLLHCPPRPHGYPIDLPGLQHGALAILVRADWVVLSAGVAALLVARARRANPHFRRLLIPMAAVACAQLAGIVGFLAANLGGGSSDRTFGAAYVATALAIPAAAFVGLVMERLSLARVLSRFVTALGALPGGSVEGAMAQALNDPGLTIYRRRAGSDTFTDHAGRAIPTSERSGRRRAVVDGKGSPAAIIDFDANLSDQEDFVQAAGKSAVMWLDKEQLVDELDIARGSLEASRARLATIADEERQRIQRDLHDGAQQHLVAMHLKLELALEAIDDEPSRCAALLAQIGDEMGQTANDLRSLASDVFPATLAEFGLRQALRDAARRMDIPTVLEANGVRRHPAEVETSLYFLCLEALQNARKHGGSGVTATVRLWEVKRWLFVEVRDTGEGFDLGDARVAGRGSGLDNMHARLAAIGAQLTIRSDRHGTLVRAAVPVGRPAKPAIARLARRVPPAAGRAGRA
jgi:signal transduction histidine kinase